MRRWCCWVLALWPSASNAEGEEAIKTGYAILDFIQAGGGWALSIIFGAAVVLLANAYRRAKDSEIALLRSWNEESKKLIRETTAAITQQAATNDAVADALDRLAAHTGDDVHAP